MPERSEGPGAAGSDSGFSATVSRDSRARKAETAGGQVVATLGPPRDEQQEARAGYEELWRELVATKARVAESINEVRALIRAFDELETYCRRHVKRIDAIASRLTAKSG